MSCLRIGSRGSRLALAQVQIVVEALREHNPEITVEIVTIDTQADRIQDRPIEWFGDKGVFIRAVERAVLEGEVDCAVHSLKDVPADTEPPGLALVAYPPRADAADVVVSRSGLSMEDLPKGSRVGTSSPRRQMLLRAHRADLRQEAIRGNVDTRLRKLDDGEYDALLLAAAGLRRLGLDSRITELLPPDRWIPDAGQGIIAVQTLDTSPWSRVLAEIDDPSARIAGEAERACIRELDAGCDTPVGVHATIGDGVLTLVAIAAPDVASAPSFAAYTGPTTAPHEAGRALARQLVRSNVRPPGLYTGS